MTPAEILSALPKLKAKDLQQIGLACDFLLKGASGSNPAAAMVDGLGAADDMELCYLAIKGRLEAAGVLAPPFHAFKRLNIYKDFQAGWPMVEAFIHKYFSDTMLQDRQRLYYLFGELLVEAIKGWQLPLTLGVVCRNMSKVPTLVHEAFPGYAEHGALGLIFRWGVRHSDN